MKRPDRDYIFATLLTDTRNPDAPGWAEVLYALATVIIMSLITIAVMTQ